jgi:hypothetical protein
MKTKKILFVILSLISTLVCLAQDTIQLKPYIGNLKSVDVFIKGVKYNFLFDSGGGETFISPEIVKLLGKEIYGSSTGIRMDGEMIKYQKADSISIIIDNSEKYHKTIGVWDIMSILPEGLPRVDGVLSLKSFVNDILTIDISKNILIIENNTFTKNQIKTKTLIPSRFANGPDGAELDIFIGIPKSGHMYWFLFDTGNIGPVILSHECATLWGLQSNIKDSDMAVTNLEFVIGKNEIKANTYSKKIIYDGSLNFESISKYIFTIDFRKKEVWIN